MGNSILINFCLGLVMMIIIIIIINNEAGNKFYQIDKMPSSYQVFTENLNKFDYIRILKTKPAF